MPRPSPVSASYPLDHHRASLRTAPGADFADPSRWLTRGKLGDALVRAARLSHRPLTDQELLASTGLSRWVMRALLDDVLVELVAAGRLLADWRQRSLFERAIVYTAAVEGAPKR